MESLLVCCIDYLVLCLYKDVIDLLKYVMYSVQLQYGKYNIRNLLYDSWLIKIIYKLKCIIYFLIYYVCFFVDDCWYYICWMNIDYIELIK